MKDLLGYFDYAAATPMDERVLSAMQPFFYDKFYNPSAQYSASREVKQAIEAARSQAAQIIGAKPAEIIFTAGGTEANNLAVEGVMRKYPNSSVVFSKIEHDSLRKAAAKYPHTECPVQPNGLVDPDELAGLVDDKTVLVSIMLANNEIGTVQPLRKISQILEALRIERKKSGNSLPLYLHTDAAQAANYLDLHVHRLGVDLMSLNGGKIYGPKQTGLLFVRGGLVLEPFIAGGGQERNLRSGTENVAGIIGFAAALKIASEMHETESRRLHDLQAALIKEVSTKIPDAIINGSLKRRLPNNLSLTIPGQDNERLLILLDEHDIMAAAGSACSASHEEPSHVLKAIGLDEKQIRASLRFSMGRYTTPESVTKLIDALASVLA